tara:strand:- start:174 stop:1442 length:1269 start_codon:yes stop_codon:yes gene_type:complete
MKKPLLETMPSSAKYNDDVRTAWHSIWVRNSARSYAEIEKRFSVKNCDYNQLPHGKGPAIILGSGPSLDDTVPYLKDWKGAILCSTSQLSVCEANGIIPTYVVLIDADPTMIYLAKEYGDSDKTTLLTHPQIPREYLECWKGDVYFFRMYDPGDDFSVDIIPKMYSQLGENDQGIGSYIMNSGNVVNTAMAICQGLEYSQVYLAGYDLGYPDDKYRFTNYKKEEGKWITVSDNGIPKERTTEMSLNGVKTDQLGLFYKFSTLILTSLSGLKVISLSRGIMGELPYLHPSKLNEEHPLPDPEEQYKIGKEYLRKREIFIQRSPAGVEMRNVSGQNKIKLIPFYLRYRLYDQEWYWKLRLPIHNWRIQRDMKRREKIVDKSWDIYFKPEEKNRIEAFAEAKKIPNKTDFVRMAVDEYMKNHLDD